MNAARQPKRWRHAREVICERSGKLRTRALIRIACMIVCKSTVLLRNFDRASREMRAVEKGGRRKYHAEIG